MANNYMMKYKGTYRVLAELDLDTNDIPRDNEGNIEEDCELYISCQNGNKITYWGLDESRRGVLIAYIPSIGRGRNIKKSMDKQGIEYTHYDESDIEVMFRFKAKDIDEVAKLMKAKTSGANISPFSIKSLPKAKVDIPLEKIEEYKAISAKIQKNDLLLINRINQGFLSEILAKKLKQKGSRKPFDYRSDMKQMKLSRDAKGYIYAKGLWDNYIAYFETEVDKFYNETTK